MSGIKQDMPPPGGFRPINFKRVPAVSVFGTFALFGGYVGMTAGALFLYYKNLESITKRELEVKGATLALYPMLLAERDRAMLKQLRINREEERELMKNVPGWKVGTWYGEPIILGGDPDKYICPTISEFYVHSSYKDVKKRAELSLWL
ncbi:NADH dehydrogenase [ubiquinone] 1 alpha subcomplex subunit 13 [Euwallacea similis]|uniref:NADH dehydrogenase [ubiquinone] 1 alpha subcomplex subunit 13 n=1 Tax=Euwallacea similis TaxID=1736056 RepID=UPI00344E0F83